MSVVMSGTSSAVCWAHFYCVRKKGPGFEVDDNDDDYDYDDDDDDDDVSFDFV